MHHAFASAIARDHIADLHRAAAERRLAHSATAQRSWVVRAVVSRGWLACSRSTTDAMTPGRL
jgi:hypothetical protein